MLAKKDALLHAANVRVETDSKVLVDNAAITINAGEVVVLLGPNGAGKTSLLRALLGMGSSAARVNILGQPVTALSTRELALRVSYLPQVRETAWPNRVFDAVALGRFAHGIALGNLSVEDTQATLDAITACDLTDLQNRNVDTLSGGELARVHCARLYAANTPLLIADEPTAGLDPQQQHRIAQLFRAYISPTQSVLMVIHDVNLALRYATRLIWMEAGRIAYDTKPDEVTAELITEIYKVKTEFVAADDGVKQFIMAPFK
ncbi:MAG: ABC transporter ATP-binding protein [Pseudomonadota bacterium]